MTDTTIQLTETERHVLDHVYDGNHTIDDLIAATGFPYPRLLRYLAWLQGEFIDITQPDGPGTELRIDLTDKGVERCERPDSRHPLSYVIH